MTNPASKKVVFAALVGNSLIAITKFGAAIFTGSSAMLSEGIHSVVDTGNQMLLLYGMRRAGKHADTAHPFGYGMELYFWTFVVAILIFAGGAGVSIYEGVVKLRAPHPITDAYVNYIVLGAAMVFEGVAWWIAFREFQRVKGSLGFLKAVRASKDPALFTVLFEDTAAMLGLTIAFVSIFLAQALGLPWLDGAGSIGIGVVLAITAVLLAYESKGLLIGEGARPAVVAGIRKLLKDRPGVLSVNEVLTMHLGPEDVLLNISIDFSDRLGSAEVEAAITELERDIKSRYPEIKRIFIEAQSLTQHRASKTPPRHAASAGPE